MLMRQISRGSPEKIFVVVKNNSGVSMDIGMAAVFDYILTAQQDGYNATIRTSNDPPAMLAGIVCSHDIGIGKYGVAQCYGHVDSVILANGADSTNPLTGFDSASLINYPLYPLATTTGAAVAGAMGTIPQAAMVTTCTAWTESTEGAAFVTAVLNAAVNAALNAHLTYNQEMWLGTWLSTGLTVNTHTEEYTTMMGKGFIKAM